MLLKILTEAAGNGRLTTSGAVAGLARRSVLDSRSNHTSEHPRLQDHDRRVVDPPRPHPGGVLHTDGNLRRRHRRGGRRVEGCVGRHCRRRGRRDRPRRRRGGAERRSRWRRSRGGGSGDRCRRSPDRNGSTRRRCGRAQRRCIRLCAGCRCRECGNAGARSGRSGCGNRRGRSGDRCIGAEHGHGRAVDGRCRRRRWGEGAVDRCLSPASGRGIGSDRRSRALPQRCGPGCRHRAAVDGRRCGSRRPHRRRRCAERHGSPALECGRCRRLDLDGSQHGIDSSRQGARSGGSTRCRRAPLC